MQVGLTGADFNGDGRLDLAVASHDTDSVWVHPGNGDGTFRAGRPFAVGNRRCFVLAADFNADGRPDLAVANLQSRDVSVLAGIDDGMFKPAVNFKPTAAPRTWPPQISITTAGRIWPARIISATASACCCKPIRLLQPT